MKDIVDRNCDSIEEEINAQIPVPLYLGLVGTMIGILVGIGYLWLSGALSDLLSAGSNNNGAEGVEALLAGVALAMISSICGILFTTIGSMNAKNAKAMVEQNKHRFLSWMQVNLLPNLSNNTALVLEKMSQNLVLFNQTFSTNTNELRDTFSSVKDTYKDTSHILEAINRLRINDIAKCNIEVYDKLKNCTDEIGNLGKSLQDVNRYISISSEITEKMATVCDREISQFDERIEILAKAVGKVDGKLQEAISKLQDNANDQLLVLQKNISRIDNELQDTVSKLQEHSNSQILELKKAIGMQQEALKETLFQTPQIADELKNLMAIKESIAGFENATHEQNRKLDSLIYSIKTLAEAKLSEQGITSPSTNPRIPKQKIILISTLSGLGILLLICLIIANRDSILEIINVLKFCK